METVQDSRIAPIIDLYDMQTAFFKSAMDGITNKDAHNRLDTKANHIAWLAGSLVQQRYELANMLDFSGASNLKQDGHDLFKDNQGIKDGEIYPKPEQYLEDWDIISPILRDALSRADEEQLETIFEMPGMKYSYYEMVTFSIYREANCIGQIALWRRLLGYEAMKYM